MKISQALKSFQVIRLSTLNFVHLKFELQQTSIKTGQRPKPTQLKTFQTHCGTHGQKWCKIIPVA